MVWNRLNLAVVRGSTKGFKTLHYWETAILSEPVKAGSATRPTTSINIEPLPIAIPAGQVLKFIDPAATDDCSYVAIKTAAIAPAYSSTIFIENYIGRAIPCEWEADVAPMDLTGRTYRAHVRPSYDDPAPLFSLVCNVIPLQGIIELQALTTTEPTNAYFYQFPDDLVENLQAVTPQSKSPVHKALIESAYKWDLECLEGGLWETTLMGFFWLIAEATR